MTDIPANQSWTPERIEQFKDYWVAGYSARKIAELMDLRMRDGGFSRNAVIGKARRLGFAPRGMSIDQKRAVFKIKQAAMNAARAERARLRDAARMAKVIVVKRRQINKPLPGPQVAPIALPDLKIPFADRTAFQCAWISGEPNMAATCCGQPTIKGSAWCQWHFSLCYVPIKPRVR